MSIQDLFCKFHKNIKVETDELREKRDIIVDKIRNSLKNSGKPVPELLNQGSYIYGVGVKPIGGTEYDIDVGLVFPIKSSDYDAKTVRKWVYDAIATHTNNVEDRGPCIRVHYAAGYHVDLVIYSKYKDNDSVENYQLAFKNNIWRPSEPKKLKEFILDRRKPFVDTKDSSGADQLQRVTRYLKRWNDNFIPGDSDDKPFGLATLLLVIEKLSAPCVDLKSNPNDLEALIDIVLKTKNTYGRIIIYKPTPEFEDVFSKLNDDAIGDFKNRLESLYSTLVSVRDKSDYDAAQSLQKQFGYDFSIPDKKEDESVMDNVMKKKAIADMAAAIPLFSNPPSPWCRG